MKKLALKTGAFSACFVVAVAAFGGCSSSSSTGSTSNGGDGGTGTSGDGGGSSTAGNICPKIPQADIQPLLANPITSVSEVDATSFLFECDVNGLSLQLNTNDGDKSLYLVSYGDGGGDTHALTGLGDEAYWWAPSSDGTGTTVNGIPTVVAHKGNVTCYISSDDDPTNYTIPTTTGAPFSITQADALAWVQKAAVVCTDFFKAAGQ